MGESAVDIRGVGKNRGIARVDKRIQNSSTNKYLVMSINRTLALFQKSDLTQKSTFAKVKTFEMFFLYFNTKEDFNYL